VPIKIQSDLPARAVLEDENVDLIISDRAVMQDIRPIKLLFLNLMPKKKKRKFSLRVCWVIALCKLNLP
jgi:homoserine O-succinyltransferase